MKYKIINWIKLFVGMALLVIFAFVLLPMAKNIKLVKDMAESNKSKGIDAETLFYTETDEFRQADNFFTNSNKKQEEKDK